MHRSLSTAGVVGALAVAACSGGSGTASLASAASSTTRADVNASVVIGDVAYPFVMNCYAPGAGAVVAVGVGVEPGTGKETRALVQAFVGDPYVGVTVGDREAVYEPALDESLELFFQDDVVRGGAIRFVKDLDVNARTSTVVGLGSLTVACASYTPGLPPGYSR